MSAVAPTPNVNSIDRFLPVADDLPGGMVEWQPEDGGHSRFVLTVFGRRSDPMHRSATKEDIKAEFDRLREAAKGTPKRAA